MYITKAHALLQMNKIDPRTISSSLYLQLMSCFVANDVVICFNDGDGAARVHVIIS